MAEDLPEGLLQTDVITIDPKTYGNRRKILLGFCDTVYHRPDLRPDTFPGDPTADGPAADHPGWPAC